MPGRTTKSTTHPKKTGLCPDAEFQKDGLKKKRNGEDLWGGKRIRKGKGPQMKKIREKKRHVANRPKKKTTKPQNAICKGVELSP